MAQMTARYAGTCATTGARIKPGDTIDYDKASKKAKLVQAATGPAPEPEPRIRYTRRQSVFTRFSGGGEHYVNRRGRCEDAPCCGCCS